MFFKTRASRSKTVRLAARKSAAIRRPFRIWPRLEFLEERTLPSTVWVTNTQDSGAGSLRQAILDADRDPNVDRIGFSIVANDPNHVYYQDNGQPGTVTLANRVTTTAADDSSITNIDPDWAHSWWVITPLTPLPSLTRGIVVDGYSQPGAQANTLSQGDNAVLRIELNGNGLVASGLVLTCNGATVQGLVVNNFYGFSGTQGQVDLEGLSQGNGAADVPITGNSIQGDFIGTDVSGTVAEGNGAHGNVAPGVLLNIAGGTLIGGPAAASRNLISGNGGSGIAIGGESSGNLVQGNEIGTDAGGLTALGNGIYGIAVSGGYAGSLNTTIGGAAAGDGNVIAANGAAGISLTGAVAGAQIAGNLIGTNVAGTAALGNHGDGVLDKDAYRGGTGLTGVTIGGVTPGMRNIISANGGWGVNLAVEDGGDVIQGNLIGTDAAGVVALGNAQGGVAIVNVASPETIGGVNSDGSATHAGNLISGNHGKGVYLGNSTASSLVQGNLIGTDITGTKPLGNRSDGVFLDSQTSDNQIGGTTPGVGNVIAFNGSSAAASGIGTAIGNGVHVFLSGPGNAILGNAIFANQLLGIDLNATGATIGDGVTPNSPGGPHSGPNDLQNTPVLTSAAAGISDVTIAGTLNSTPSTTFRVEFFANAVGDPTGHGQGQTYLGFASLTTDGTGNTSFSTDLPVSLPSGQWVISSTSTDPAGNTSEFSGNVTAVMSQVPPSVNTSPTDATACAGDSVTFTAAAAGTPTPTVQWQVSTDGGASFSDIPGATSSALTFAADPSQNSDLYQAVFTNAAGAATTSPAQLTVKTDPIVTINPSNQTVAVNGLDRLGIFDPVSATFYLRDEPGLIPLTGDWTGTGHLGIGAYDPSTATFYLRNELSAGPADVAKPFQFGAPGWIPLTGDWTGTGHTGIGAYDPSTATFYLRNELSAGPPDVAKPFQFGAPGWIPLTGDWTGTGHTSIGAFDPTTGIFYLRTQLNGGPPDAASPFAFGTAGWVPVTGDWNGLGHAGIGVFDPGSGTLFQRNELSAGPSDATTPFQLGAPAWLSALSAGAGSSPAGNEGTANFTVAASGDPATVQWEVSRDGGKTFRDIPGATSATLSFLPTVYEDGNEYRAVFTNDCGTTTTSAATLTLTYSVSGVVFDDKNANGVIDPGESPLSGWTVYLSQDHNSQPQSAVLPISSTDVPHQIPSLSSVSSTSTVAGAMGVVTDVTVTVDLTHAAGVTMYLVAPSGTRVLLLDSVAGFNDNFQGTTLDDRADTPITAGQGTFTGRFQPQGSLADFNGLDPNGDWHLEVRNGGEDQISTLNDWSMSLTVGDPVATTGADGRFSFVGLEAASYVLNEVAQIGWTPTAAISRNVFPSGQEAINAFGNAHDSTISGSVFNDRNGDGQQEPSEPGVAGQTVFVDYSGTGVPGDASLIVPDFYWSPTQPDAPYNDNLFLPITSAGLTYNLVVISGATGSVWGGVVSVTIWAHDPSLLRFTLISPSGRHFDLPTDPVLVTNPPDKPPLGEHAYELAMNWSEAGVREDIDGTWQLGFSDGPYKGPGDLFPYGDSLVFMQIGFGVTEPTTRTDAQGNYALPVDGGFSLPISGGSSAIPSFDPGTYPLGLHTTSDWLGTGATQMIQVLNENSTVTANFAVISLLPPTVTVDPSDQTVDGRSQVSFTAAANGSPPPTVQWQVSRNGGATFSDLSGATSTTLTLAPADEQDGNLYRAVFSNPGGTATTRAALLTVSSQFSSISGTVFNDLNGDGIQESGEPGLAGRTVYLDTGATTPVVEDNQTSQTLIANSTATSTVNVMGAVSGISDVSIVLVIDGSPDVTTSIYLTNPTGMRVLVDQGRLGDLESSGLPVVFANLPIFNGQNANGVWTLSVNRPSDGAPAATLRSWELRFSEPSLRQSVQTDSQGRYTLQHVSQGTHVIREVLPSGWTETSPVNGHVVVMIGGQPLTGHDFGSAVGSAVALEPRTEQGAAFPLVVTAPIGGRVTLSASAYDLPYTHVQWYRIGPDGHVSAIPGADSPVLSFVADASQSGTSYQASFIMPASSVYVSYTSIVQLSVVPITAGMLQSALDLSSIVTLTATTNTDVHSVVAAVNRLTPSSVPEMVIVNVGSGTYSGITISPPANVTVVINGTSGSTTFVGNSPALTVLSGTVFVNDVTLRNATQAPTVLVAGGRLTLRGDRVEETTKGNQPAVSIVGGTVDLGTTAAGGLDPGNNTFNVHTTGVFIQNTGRNPVPALGDVFTVNGVRLVSPYQIQSRIVSVRDAAGHGLVTVGAFTAPTSSWRTAAVARQFSRGNGNTGKGRIVH